MLGYSPHGMYSSNCNFLRIFNSGASTQSNAYIEGTWYVHINDLNCTGEEESIWGCPQNGLSRYSYNHSLVASVICQCKWIAMDLELVLCFT